MNEILRRSIPVASSSDSSEGNHFFCKIRRVSYRKRSACRNLRDGCDSFGCPKGCEWLRKIWIRIDLFARNFAFDWPWQTFAAWADWSFDLIFGPPWNSADQLGQLAEIDKKLLSSPLNPKAFVNWRTEGADIFSSQDNVSGITSRYESTTTGEQSTSEPLLGGANGHRGSDKLPIVFWGRPFY